ncbi:hypothetical protein LCGC14_2360040 [marine sediment metagenome]|uniref:Uncharacterized protein n=1 Tax=marine sediment metagenome TaxID=412755 RepID=A0A0F9F1Q6_9ZZZZ
MANEILYKVGTPIVWADTTDYSPTAARTLGSRTDQIDVTSLAAAAARQGVKKDLGAVRSMLYDVRINFQPAADPTAGGSVDVYWSPSQSGTADIGNVGHCTGADAAYAAVAGLTLAELLAALHFVGSAPVAIQNDADGVQSVHVGMFSPTARYGSPVIVNSCSQAFDGDAIEFALLFEPMVAEIQ